MSRIYNKFPIISALPYQLKKGFNQDKLMRNLLRSWGIKRQVTDLYWSNKYKALIQVWNDGTKVNLRTGEGFK